MYTANSVSPMVNGESLGTLDAGDIVSRFLVYDKIKVFKCLEVGLNI